MGVLALQGDFIEHMNIFKKLGINAVEVRLPSDLKDIDGLIIPGGESTTIAKLMVEYGLDKAIIEKYNKGMPIYGSCAGAIILAKEIDNEQPKLGLMDISVRRNAYGRQIDSFEADLYIDGLGKIKGIFIRAPLIDNVFNGVKVLSRFDSYPIMAEQGHLLVTTFHPELTDDIKVHKYFVDMVKFHRML